MEHETVKGTFLIASPQIQEGIFARSVVLLCENDESGSLGLIVNRPLRLELPGEILDLGGVEEENLHILSGGPVQTNQLMLLHMCSEVPDQTMLIAPDIYLGGDLEFLRNCKQKKYETPLRLCFGYAGWKAGQLAEECRSGSWYTAKATAEYLFFEDPETLWRKLLLDKGGKYASISMIPEDLSWN